MSNPYYNHATYPTPNSPGSSAALRAELSFISDGFDLLPTLAGNGYKVVMVNSTGTALIASSALQSLAITSSTIDSTVIGAITRAAGNFTSLSVNGTAGLGNAVTIGGGTINATTIGGTTPSSGAFTTLSASGGITGNLTGNVTGNVTGNLQGNVTGDVTGNVTAASGTSTFNNVTINGTLDMNSGSAGTITGLAAPTTDTDAANKAYVDQVAQGLDAKASCRVATTASITLSGTQTIDGVAVIAGDRVLVKDQGSPAENGIYVAASGGWSRAADANAWDELVKAFVFVEEGTAGANNGFVCTVAAGGSLGSTAVTWVQFSGAGQITAGNGMTKTGNTLNVGTAAASRIVVNADDIDLAASGITPGTYRSLTIDAYGRATAGTNPTTLAGYGITDAYTKTEIDSIFGSTTAAAASASAAATSATNAANSATAASSSASAAATSATNAANSYDAFDDRYLGSKTSDPTLDNDGNALLTGALYWNSAVNEMRVYTGSVWLQAYLPASGYLALSGGTMTGTITFAGGQTFPGTGDVTLNGSQTLTNKTLTAPVLTNVTILASTTATQDGVVINGRAGGTGSFRVTITPDTLTASRALTLPDNSGTILTTGAVVTIAQGGTGQTTANAALNALLPTQTSNSGRYLTTDGTNTSWASVATGAQDYIVQSYGIV